MICSSRIRPWRVLALIGDQSQLGGGVALIGVDAGGGDVLLQAGRKRLARDQRALQAGYVRAGLARFIDQDFEKRGRADIAVGPEVGYGPQLQLGLAGAARHHGAAQGKGRAFEHRPGRGQVIGEAIMHQLAWAEAGGVKRALEAPEIRPSPLGLVDRPGRHEEPRKLFLARRVEAGEGRIILLQLDERALARHGQLGERARLLTARGSIAASVRA